MFRHTVQKNVFVPSSGDELMEFTSVTIIIGMTDETDSLKKTVDYIMENCDYDDLSKVLMVKSKNASEGCNEAIAFLEEKYGEKVRGLEQTRPYIGGAIRDGFDAAESSHIMLLPSDLAISLECIPEMIRRVKAKPDVISKTSRWLKKDSFHEYNGLRKIINKLSQIFLRVLYSADLTDFTSPVQTAPTEAYMKSVWQELNFPFLLEMVLVPLRRGYRFEEFAVGCYGRQQGKSKNSAKQTALYLKTALRIRFTKKSRLTKE